MAEQTPSNQITGSSGTLGTSGATGFCGQEERVSTHVCNSVFPAVSIPPNGKQGIVWHDNRDGDFEVYMRILDAKVPPVEQQEADKLLMDRTGERLANFACSGFSAAFGGPTSPSGLVELDKRCSGDEALAGAGMTDQDILTRLASGRIDVNDATKIAILSAESTNVNFPRIGVQPGMRVVIEQGANAGRSLTISQVLADNVLDLNYVPGLVSDAGFVFTLYKSAAGGACKALDCEMRLTCAEGASLFPDVVADGAGRYHVVYQDDAHGTFQLNYIQVADRATGLIQGCKDPIPARNQGGFAEVPASQIESGVAGIQVMASDGTLHYYPKTGSVGQMFAYGDRLMPVPVANQSGPNTSWTGLHSLFRDFLFGDGKWTGLSKAADRVAWDAQVASLGPPITPPLVVSSWMPMAGIGDFGSRHDFGNLAFMMQAPPDRDVRVRKVGIPLTLRTAPPAEALGTPRYQDLVAAPKRPMPPNFVDPVDVSRYLASPRVKVDPSVPARFVIEGDLTGTVYTNMLIQYAPGEFSRLIFHKDDQDDYKFILGQTRCGFGPCAAVASQSTTGPSEGYKVTFQAWLGGDYRLQPGLPGSASMAAEKLFEKEFTFSAGDDMSLFGFRDGELTFPAGSMMFIAIIPPEGLDYSVVATGNGNAIWTTSEDGQFDQYHEPYTLLPYQGLTAPVYYFGRLAKASIRSGSSKAQASTDKAISFSASGDFLKPVDMDFNGVIGVAYSPVLDKIIASVNYPTGSTMNLATIDGHGKYAQFSALANATDELNICCVRKDLGGWQAGTVFCGNGQSGIIVKISPDGTSVQNPWITLPSIGLLRGSLAMDETGIYGYSLVAAMTTGEVYLIKPDGSFTNLASLGVHLEGMVVLPKDDQYGPWSGKILIGAEEQTRFWTVDEDGNTQSWDLGIRPESIQVVEEGQNLYAVSYMESIIYGAGPDVFSECVGDLLITQESPGLMYLLKWDGTRFVTKLIAEKDHFEQVIFTTAGVANFNPSIPQKVLCNNQYLATLPFQLTISQDNEHPRMAIDQDDNIWLAWHSKRTGSEEVFVGRYMGDCGVWDMPTMGGNEFQLTNFSLNGSRAMFPNVAVDLEGEVHVVFQGNDAPDRKWEIYYVGSTGGGATFLPPIRLTNSPGDAMMPDVAVTYEGGAKRINVLWHDSRFGGFQVMSAVKAGGRWRSSQQGSSDLRVTSSARDALFPRLAPDKDGNVRVVYHDTRMGQQKANVFMSTYSSQAHKWISSAQGGFDQLVSNGPSNSLFPDIASDLTGGVCVTWHDDRFMVEDPDQHEEIMARYCDRLGQAGKPHFAPLITNIEAKLVINFDIVDCVDFSVISLTNVPEVCLRINAPGATFWRARNEEGPFSGWEPFRPTYDLDTTIVPWKLSCGNGAKQVCIQIQDAAVVGFPVCQQVALAMSETNFQVRFFSDSGMTSELPTYKDWPITAGGDVFIRMEAPEPQVIPPTFDVITRGSHNVFNQEALPLDASGFSGFGGTSNTSGTSGFSGTSAASETSEASGMGGAGIGSYAGKVVQGSEFSAYAGKTFAGRFRICKDDGMFHRDGLSRVIVHSRNICGGTEPPVPGDFTDTGSDVTMPIPPTPLPAHTPWVATTNFIWMELPDMSFEVHPTTMVPWGFGNGGVAQVFPVTAPVVPTEVLLRLARRNSRDSFGRSLTLEIVDAFTLAVVFAQEISADLVPGVAYDPSINTLSADLDVISIPLTGAPTLAPWLYALVLSDYTNYANYLKVGLDADIFVMQVGTPGTPDGIIPMFSRIF